MRSPTLPIPPLVPPPPPFHFLILKRTFPGDVDGGREQGVSVPAPNPAYPSRLSESSIRVAYLSYLSESPTRRAVAESLLGLAALAVVAGDSFVYVTTVGVHRRRRRRRRHGADRARISRALARSCA